MWQSFEIKGSEETLDHVLPGLVAPLYQNSNRSVTVDRFFFIRTQSDASRLHVSSDEPQAESFAAFLEARSKSQGVQIKPCSRWVPSVPMSRKARNLIEKFAEHSSRHSLFLLTRPKPERLARMCFFDALLAYHFLRSEVAVKVFFREHAEILESQMISDCRQASLETYDRVYRPLRAMFHFCRTRKKSLAPRLEEWNRVCREIADAFMVMAMNRELIFLDGTKPAAEMKVLLRYMIEEHHTRLCFTEENKVTIARGIAGVS